MPNQAPPAGGEVAQPGLLGLLGTAGGVLGAVAFGVPISTIATVGATVAAVGMGSAYLYSHLTRGGGGGSWGISIITYREGKFSDLVGHVSVALWSDGNIVTCAGLSPDPLPDAIDLYTIARLITTSTTGKIYSDYEMLNDGEHVHWEEKFSVSKDRWDAALQIINRDSVHAPRYNLLGIGGDSCASWAIKVLDAAGCRAGSVVSRYLLSVPRELSLYGQ